jgi:hypothetical protein
MPLPATVDNMLIGFPGHFNITKDPLGRFDRATLNVKGNAQLDYQETII